MVENELGWRKVVQCKKHPLSTKTKSYETLSGDWSKM